MAEIACTQQLSSLCDNTPTIIIKTIQTDFTLTFNIIILSWHINRKLVTILPNIYIFTYVLVFLDLVTVFLANLTSVCICYVER